MERRTSSVPASGGKKKNATFSHTSIGTMKSREIALTALGKNCVILASMPSAHSLVLNAVAKPFERSEN